MLAILLLAAEKHKATFIAPIGIGLALFVSIVNLPVQCLAHFPLGGRAPWCLLHWRIVEPCTIFWT